MRKICIVTYYWPPAGGPGVQRWLFFCKYLPVFNYQAIVYIPENPSYPIKDESLLSEVPSTLTIIKKKIWEPYFLAGKISKKNKKYQSGQLDEKKSQGFLEKLSLFIRGNFFIPDARKFWIRPSVKFLRHYLAKENIELLVTTGPPHSMHLIGLELKKLNPKIKWIADFRDPWTQISYHSQLKLTKFAYDKHKKLEKEVLSTANLVIATSYTDAENFKKAGANRVICITNGFNDYLDNNTKKTTKFTISYIGMLEQLRNPVNLWKVLEKIIKDKPQFKNDFQINLIGKIDTQILEQLKNSPLKDVIFHQDYVSHKKALEYMQNSDILLITNFNKDQSKGIIPGKLFEYLSARKVILSIGVKNSDVEEILSMTKSGKNFTYEDSSKIENFIINEYNNWLKGSNVLSPLNVDKFHRKHLTHLLANQLDRL